MSAAACLPVSTLSPDARFFYKFFRVIPLTYYSVYKPLISAHIPRWCQLMVRPLTKLVTVKMPEIYVEGLDVLVRMGKYSSRSEAIRAAVRMLLEKELQSKVVVDKNVVRRVKKVRVG